MVKPWVSVAVFIPVLGGCIATNYVLSIGGREMYAAKDPIGHGNEIALELKDAPLEVQYGHPMASTGPATDKARRIGTVTVNLDNVKWDNVESSGFVTKDRFGSVELDVMGTPTEFRIRKYEDRVVIDHTYRHWYGYPAQVLLVGAVPIDAVIFLVMIPVGIVYSIFSD